MKVSHYSICGPWPKQTKQWSIMAREENSSGYFTLVYLQRPKWIKNDSGWEKICMSIKLNLPKNFKVGQ